MAAPWRSTPAWRLSTGGYLGHMFELYAAWTWLPVFIAASIAAHGLLQNLSVTAVGDFYEVEAGEYYKKLTYASFEEYVEMKHGFARTKAKNVIAMAEILVREHGGEVPSDRDALTALPGVGRKTANVVLNCAFGAETFAVDTHIFRVGNRTGLAPGKTPLAVELKLDKRVPPPFRRDAHHWLILHGRYVCTARSPRCDVCTVRPWCDTGKALDKARR